MPISFDRNVLTESFDRNVLTESFDRVFFLEPCFEFGGPGLGCGLAGAGLVGQSSIGFRLVVGRAGAAWLGLGWWTVFERLPDGGLLGGWWGLGLVLMGGLLGAAGGWGLGGCLGGGSWGLLRGVLRLGAAGGGGWAGGLGWSPCYGYFKTLVQPY